MSLSEEQFNETATKKEVNEVKEDVAEVKKDVKSLLKAVDSMTTKVEDIEHAFVSNQAAHDRSEKRLEKIEKHLNLT
jgi:septal ring factor EnvC (AmiA/AmiB activator)